MKKFYIVTDSSLGNHIISLLSGLVIAKYLKRTPTIIWSRTNVCDISFNDIWKNTEFNVIEKKVSDFFKNDLNEKYELITHGSKNRLETHNAPFINFDLVNNINNRYSINTSDEDFYKFIEDLQNVENIVYFYPRLFPRVILNKIMCEFYNFKFHDKFLEYAKKFVELHKIDYSVHGLHVRKTDSEMNLVINPIIDIVKKSPNHRFFVCSDCPETEILLSKYNNVLYNPKKFFTTKKFKDKDWRDYTVDDEGRNYPSNVIRNKESIEEAIKDILILSRTTIQNTNESTFRITSLVAREIIL